MTHLEVLEAEAIHIIPFAVMHVDTGHNFPEVIEFRDRHVLDIVVASVQESSDRGETTNDAVGAGMIAEVTADVR